MVISSTLVHCANQYFKTMKTMKTDYKQAKQALKNTAKIIKEQYKNDYPYIRQIINDTAFVLSKDYNLSNYKYDLLSNYACKLHPKD